MQQAHSTHQKHSQPRYQEKTMYATIHDPITGALKINVSDTKTSSASGGFAPGPQ